MECVYKCNITNLNERVLTCWLCDKHGHLKCAGFTGRHFDLITDRKNGLRWACINCRSLEVDFYRLFKESKIEIAAMKKDFNAVHTRLENFEKLFMNFEYVDGSPKRKKSSAIASGENLITLNSPSVAPPRKNLGTLHTENQLAPPALYSSVCSNVNPATASSPSVKTPVEVQSSEVTPNNPQIPPSIIICAPENAPSTSNNDLIVVAPRKSIFVSRLHPSTSVDNISNYIKSKIQNVLDNDYNILKFNSSIPRDLSSFKITVHSKLYDLMLKDSFWPDGTLVKEFEFRKRRNFVKPITLPSDSNVPKN